MGPLDPRRARWIKVRIWILVVALIVGAGAVARGAWDLGVSRRDELTSMAREQYSRRITLSARRGMITDRHGEELAVEVEVDSIYADPRQVENPAATATMLAPLLNKDATRLASKLGSRKHFIWIKRRVPPDVAAQVRQLDLAGIELVKESKRFYPNRGLAAQVVGFAGVDSRGLEGIERRFDEELRGKADAASGLSDARGRVVFSDGVFGTHGVVGNSVELTIDRTLQYIAEQELANTIRTFEARAGQVLVLDPATSEVLAMANWPTYNPNAINKSVAEQRRNRTVLDVLEPGSTFKVFTLAAALNTGAIRPDDTIFCERGRMQIYDAAIHDDHRDGWLNPTQCLKRSSNICFAKIALKLGKRRLYHYLRRFGFGERTHVRLPAEMSGTLLHYKKWYDIDAATIAFGQGIGVTGMQMANGLAAVANGGMLMRPSLVRRIVGPDGETVRNFPPQPRRRVISRYTARLVADMMTAVTEEGGTGTQGALDGYLVAGKTGTAQKSEGAKGYHSEKWVASFVGFVPSDRPRLVITVIIDEPVINHYGGTVAAPALRRIADQSLRYLGVAPRQVNRPRQEQQRARGNRAKLEPELPAEDGEELVEAEQPLDDQLVEPAAGQVLTPPVVGLTMPEALAELTAVQLRPLFLGTGVAVEQVPPPGDPIDEGEFVQVNFQPLFEASGGEGDDTTR